MISRDWLKVLNLTFLEYHENVGTKDALDQLLEIPMADEQACSFYF